MLSKTFSFKPGLVRNDLRRTWPLWAFFTLPEVLWQIALILAARQDYERMFTRTGSDALLNLGESVRRFWCNQCTMAPFFNFAYGGAVAVILIQNLYTARSAVGTHILPVTRPQKWLSWVVSGFVLEAIPLAVTTLVGLVGWVGLPGITFGSVPLILTYLLWMVCSFCWGFGFAMFCGMFVGQLWAVSVFTVVLNFLGIILNTVWMALKQATLYGYNANFELTWGMLLSPFARIVSRSRIHWVNGIARMEGTSAVVLAGVLGLVFMVLALLVYRIRPLERAGDLVVFRPFRGIFRVGFSLCVGICGGLLMAAIREKVDWWILLYTILFAAVGLYAAQMMVKKSLKALSKRLILEFAVVAAVISAVLGILLTGGFGYAGWVPKAEDVAGVTLRDSSSFYGERAEFYAPSVVIEDPAEIQAVVDWHRSYLNKYPNQAAADESLMHRREQVEVIDWGVNVHRCYLTLTYHMKDGRNISRYYNFDLSQKDIAAADTMEWQMAQLWGRVLNPAQLVLENKERWAVSYTNDLMLQPNTPESKRVLDALARDMAMQGGSVALLHGEEDFYQDNEGILSLYGQGSNGSAEVYLQAKTYPNTMAILEELSTGEYAEETLTPELVWEK